MPPLNPNPRIRYADLVDIAGLQALMDGFQQVLGIANAILDRDGTVLTQSGWQDLCLHFHRRHPQTLQRCVESDTSLAHSLLEGKPYAAYRCLNGLVDAAMPIVVAGEHVANAFAGQFFSAPPDREFFRRQAREFGFDEADYLAAVAKVPIVPPERIEPITRLFAHVAEFLGEQALQRLRLREAADEISDRKRSEASLRRHQALLEMIARGVPLPNILQAIAIHAETERPGLRCSILLLEPDGKHLRIGAAPSLPDFFNEAIEGMAIGPTKGSCGAAAYNGSRIITTNIASHPNWRHYRAVAEQAGLASCWSEPVRSSNGQLLGSLAFYTATPAEPNELDLAMIEYTANLAGIAIEHHKTREELERQAQLDYLTGLANRRHFLTLAEMALAGAVRYGRALSVLMLDIDHFKAINDSQGHAVGDLVLQKLGEICRQNLRKMDLIGRWGGEEFAVLLPETDGQAAFEGSERLRQALAAGELALPSGRVLQFTVSIGLATLATDEASVETLIERADQALYVAKREGRNRVCWAATATDFHCVPEPSTTAAGSARESNVARYARAIDTSMDGYLLADARGRLLDANEALCQLTGYTRAQLLDMSVAQLSEDNGGQSVLSRLAQIAPLGKARFDSRWRRRDGEWIAVEISATHVAEEGGLYFVFVRDVTPIQLAQQRLRHVTQLYAFLSHANAAIVHNPNPAVLLPELCRIAVEDGGFGLVWVGWRNPANDEVEPIAACGPASHYLQSIRLSASAAVPEGRGPTGIAIREGRPVIVNDFLADPLTALWRDIAREHGLRASATYPLRQGPSIVGAIMFYAGEAGYFDQERADLLANLANDISFAIETDMSALKKAEQRIDYLAYYDPLTDLPNRALLVQRAELALALAGRHQEPLAVLFLDLDRFKAVNDSLGHEAGDALLLQVAQRLRDIVRETDTICRLGGDEFALLLPGDGHSGALAASRKILEALQEPVIVAQHALTASAALGIAVYPQDGQSFGELMKNAEAAMYQAKQQGRNAMAFYDPAMNQSALNRLLLEESLRKAIQTGQLRTHYQAKIRLDDDRLVGAEALVRWQHPEHGLIPPAQFIPLAESSGLIEAIGDWVLNDVIQQLAHWREQGLPPLPVAVNLAARHFRNTQLPGQLNALLARHGLSADVLELELTESILLDADAAVLQTLGELRDLGIGLAIDDFGTGYSSLSYLRRFPITTIKIDQSFVRDLEEDPEDRTLALSIIALGHSLGLTVVAEGVETQAQRDILLQQGCDIAQGYWFSRPLPAEDFATWRQSAP